MLLYYITDRSQFSGDEVSRRRKLLEKIAEAARCEVDFIQLREKDLSARDLESFARDAMAAIRDNSSRIRNTAAPTTRLLINSRTDVAIACRAAGVHLRSDDVSPESVRKAWKRYTQSARGNVIVSVACHSVPAVRIAADNCADFALFGPVFEKAKAETQTAIGVTPTGLSLLRDACDQNITVVALGGVTKENARVCVGAGAAGIAGIRIFQNNQIGQVVRDLRG